MICAPLTRLTTVPFINRERYLADMEWKRRLHEPNGTPGAMFWSVW